MVGDHPLADGGVQRSSARSRWLGAHTLDPGGKSTNLDPVTIFVAILAGGSVLGVYGMLISIPVAACLKIMLSEVVVPKLQRDWEHVPRAGTAADLTRRFRGLAFLALLELLLDAVGLRADRRPDMAASCSMPRHGVIGLACPSHGFHLAHRMPMPAI